MSKKRLSVVVTRRLPEAVETRLSELFDVTLREDDRAMTREELAAAMRQADVLVPTITDEIDAALISQAGERPKRIANYRAGVGATPVGHDRPHGVPGAETRARRAAASAGQRRHQSHPRTSGAARPHASPATPH